MFLIHRLYKLYIPLYSVVLAFIHRRLFIPCPKKNWEMILFHFLSAVAFLTVPFFGNLFSSLFNPISVPLNVGIIFDPAPEST